MTQQTEMPPDLTRLERLARNAALVLRWEALWPGLAALLVLAAVFLALSWLGLWLSLPRWGRVAGVALFAVAALFLVWTLLDGRAPDRKQRLARLDRDSGLAHRPASAMADALANPSADPATQALWALHRKRLAAAAAKLRLAAPSPRLADKDRFALRAGALVALIAAAFVAGPERGIRLMSAFDWRASAAADAAGFRIDAWIDPPAYTGRPPVLLDLRAPEAAAAVADRTAKVQAPVNSVLVVRTAGEGDFKIEVEGGLKAEAATPGKADGERRYVLRGDGKARFLRGGAPVAAFDLHVIPDVPPSIALTAPPVNNLRGTMTLNYKIADDYGVASAEATFAKPGLRGKVPAGRSLAEPPRFGLTLPATPGGLGAAQTIGDVADHPWGGATATMTLSAKDEGGNTGASEPVEVILPQRAFAKPLARALAEQRRNLVLMPDDSARVGRVLDALMIAPDTFGTKAAVYLGLRTAATRLAAAKSDADLLAVADYLWEMALRIEDGDLSQAERDLRAAQNALREAMARGADDKELKKLMDDVRAALDKFMKELAEKQMRENGDQQQQQAQNQRPGKMLTPDDFKAMMDKIEEMAKSGNLAEAQKMLDRMQKMLENLQTAKRRPPNPQQQQMARDLNELDAMAKEQQDLRDQTFKQEQKNRRQQQAQKNGDKAQPNRAPRQKGQKSDEPQDQQDSENGDAGDDSADSGDAQSAEQSQQALKDRQQALRERLDALQQRMKQRGQNGDDGLGEAEDAMKEAEGALGEGEGSNGKASGAQGRALENLRKGAQKMAQAMKDMQGEGEGGEQAGDDEGEGDPGQQQGQGQGGKDPLGRENDPKGRNDNARGLNEEGVPAARRAQQVLEELRKRLGETARPREELDYLERLLKRY